MNQKQDQIVTIYLAKKRGFCMGVKRSLRLAKTARLEHQGPVYILNEIVHNSSVVAELAEAGLPSIKDISEVSSGYLLISAHGVPRQTISEAVAKGLQVIDTTCPLVRLIQRKATDYAASGYTVILLGDPQHDEVKGIVGAAPDRTVVIKKPNDIDSLPEIAGAVVLLSQSTNLVSEFMETARRLRERYPHAEIQNTICRPTIVRQSAVEKLATLCQLVIVVGSPNSANSRRLAQLASRFGARSYLIDNANELNPDWLDDAQNIGLTAGASTPEHLLQEVLGRVHQLVATRAEAVVIEV